MIVKDRSVMKSFKNSQSNDDLFKPPIYMCPFFIYVVKLYFPLCIRSLYLIENHVDNVSIPFFVRPLRPLTTDKHPLFQSRLRIRSNLNLIITRIT